MLRPENRPIYDQVKHFLDSTGKCILVTHPGRGKSFITDEYIQEAGLKNVLCICPRVAIVKQWTSLHSNCIRAITYAAFAKMDLRDIGTPDLIVIDEAHHAGAPKWGKIIPLLIGKAKPNGLRVIGLTADPIRWSDKRRNIATEFFQDCQVYGPTITESIDQGFIQSFTYVLSMYGIQSKLNTLKKKAAKMPIEQREEAFTLIGKMQYLPDIVLDTVKCMQAYTQPGRHKAIIFCSRISEIDHARELIQAAYPDMPHFIMHTKKTPAANRNAFNCWLQHSHAALFNIDMISEGIHAPNADIIVMFRKTGSPNLYVQQVGRAISPDNPNAVIFDVVSNAGNIAKVLKRAGFEETDDGQIIPLITGPRTNVSGRTNPKQAIIQNLARPAADALQKIENLLSESRPWTDQEEAYLKANIGVISVQEMHEQGLSSRTPTAIATHAQKLYPNVSLRVKPKPVSWTEARIKWAITFYKQGKPLDYICKLMTAEKDDLIAQLEANGIAVRNETGDDNGKTINT